MNAKKIDCGNEPVITEESALLSQTLEKLRDPGQSPVEDLSPEVASCAQALTYFKGLNDIAQQQVGELGLYNHPEFCRTKDFAAWEKTTHVIEYQQRMQWQDATLQGIIALEKCLRCAPCKTLGDIRVKMRLTSYFASFGEGSTHEDYSEESLELVRSIAAMFGDGPERQS